MQPGLRRRTSGFTLVEILVVIVIIGILAALLTPAVLRALDTAKDGATIIEINMLKNAIEAYRSEYGEYPPDFSDEQAVINHLNRIFPRRQEFLKPNDLPDLDHAHALVFWLRGFYPNPEFPITGNGVGDRQPLVEINTAMIQGDGDLETLDDVFAPSQFRGGDNPPYVYFDSRTCSDEQSYWWHQDPNSVDCYPKWFEWPLSANETLVAVPLLTSRSLTLTDTNAVGEFVNAKSFQIISAGRDKRYGYVISGQQIDTDTWFSDSTSLRDALVTDALKPISDGLKDHMKAFPSGLNYKDADRDNLTSFSSKNLDNAIE